MLKRASQSKKIDDVHFFFSSLRRQPTNRGPVRHSDPGTPLRQNGFVQLSFFSPLRSRAERYLSSIKTPPKGEIHVLTPNMAHLTFLMHHIWTARSIKASEQTLLLVRPDEPGVDSFHTIFIPGFHIPLDFHFPCLTFLLSFSSACNFYRLTPISA